MLNPATDDDSLGKPIYQENNERDPLIPPNGEGDPKDRLS